MNKLFVTEFTKKEEKRKMSKLNKNIKYDPQLQNVGLCMQITLC